ncbi:aspartate aminotransferase family protein [Tepidamorphus sp. 3E244]|uniref:aspartate aminotransferase family protein n=1 Tax=Tepidamorphus sp. 3E244 TaxID=3385498 RepID=UPI0038FC2947
MVTAILPTYARAELAFERGEGARVYTVDGEEFLDFSAGIAVNSLGHAHPHLVAALNEQAGKLWHTSNAYRIPQQERLAERLREATFADTMFFTNSGTEAIECAVKMARRYHFSKGAPERFRLITFEGAFHGRTLAAIAAGGQAKYLEGFGPATQGFDQVPFGDLDAVRKAIGPETAGILIEPIQGEGGLRVAPPQLLRDLRALCDEHGLLLIFDEIQCGVARTGHLFAHEASGVTPDIMAIAKGIGGGFPIGACLATEEAGSGMVAGTHGSTFGGNPLACAVGNAVLDVVLEDGFLERVQNIGLRLRQGLAELQDAHPGAIAEIRGDGLMLGIRCNSVENRAVLAALRDERMLAVAAGDNVVRLLPPLVIDENDVADALARLDRAFTVAESALTGDAA